MPYESFERYKETKSPEVVVAQQRVIDSPAAQAVIAGQRQAMATVVISRAQAQVAMDIVHTVEKFLRSSKLDAQERIWASDLAATAARKEQRALEVFVVGVRKCFEENKDRPELDPGAIYISSPLSKSWNSAVDMDSMTPAQHFYASLEKKEKSVIASLLKKYAVLGEVREKIESGAGREAESVLVRENKVLSHGSNAFKALCHAVKTACREFVASLIDKGVSKVETPFGQLSKVAASSPSLFPVRHGAMSRYLAKREMEAAVRQVAAAPAA